MATKIDEGWLYLTDGTDIFKLYYTDLNASWKWQGVDITHFVGSSRSANHYYRINTLLWDRHHLHIKYIVKKVL